MDTWSRLVPQSWPKDADRRYGQGEPRHEWRAGMTDEAIINQTLELIAERFGDPTPYVFKRLFAQNPEMEALFVRDTGGQVRGQMLSMVLDSLLDHIGSDSYGAALVQIERVNHVGLGVEPEVFDTFFDVVLDTFRDLLGGGWTPEMEDAWPRQLAGLRHGEG